MYPYGIAVADTGVIVYGVGTVMAVSIIGTVCFYGYHAVRWLIENGKKK